MAVIRFSAVSADRVCQGYNERIGRKGALPWFYIESRQLADITSSCVPFPGTMNADVLPINWAAGEAFPRDQLNKTPLQARDFCGVTWREA